MSFLDSIVGAAKSVVETVAPMALAAVFPPAAMLGPLSNLATSMLGGALGGALGQIGQQCGMPNFVLKQAQSLLQGVVSQLLKPVDPQCMDHVADKAGGAIKDLVSNIINDFKDIFQNYLNDAHKKGEGKGCGKGGSAGGAGGGGAIGFRELAAILAELEQKQAKNVQNAVQKASDALGVDSSQQGAEQQQFQAMEESKAEAQIFQSLSSAISEVMKNFGGALNTAARGG